MQNIKNKIKNIVASGTTIMVMTAPGCATMDDQQEEKAKIILSTDFTNDKISSSFDRICLRDALKEVRNAEAEKYSSDADKQNMR